MGPLQVRRVRVEVMKELLAKGVAIEDINSVIDVVNADFVGKLAATDPAVAAEFNKVGTLGDGTILNNIISAIQNFFKSPGGQQLMAAIIAALMKLLVP